MMLSVTAPHVMSRAEVVDTVAVAFEPVSFAFDDHVLLRDISFWRPRGGMTIPLGASCRIGRFKLAKTSTSCCEIPTMAADNSALVLEISVENAERFVATAWHAHCPPHRGDTG